jgi:hypothetical protein
MARPWCGPRSAAGPALGAYFERPYPGQYSWRPSWRQPQAPAPLPGGILLPFHPSFLGRAKVQPHAPCRLKDIELDMLGVEAISVFNNPAIIMNFSRRHEMPNVLNNRIELSNESSKLIVKIVSNFIERTYRPALKHFPEE